MNFVNKNTMEVMSEQEYRAYVEKRLSAVYRKMKEKDTLDYPFMTLEEFLYNRIDVNGLDYVYEDWYRE